MDDVLKIIELNKQIDALPEATPSASVRALALRWIERMIRRHLADVLDQQNSELAKQLRELPLSSPDQLEHVASLLRSSLPNDLDSFGVHSYGWNRFDGGVSARLVSATRSSLHLVKFALQPDASPVAVLHRAVFGAHHLALICRDDDAELELLETELRQLREGRLPS